MSTKNAPAVPPVSPALNAGRRRALVLLLLILSLAAALRFYRIGAKSLWLDEVMSVRLARLPKLGDVVREVARYDVHPPLFPMVHVAWMRFGDSDGLARVPPAIFGVLTVAMLYLLTSRLYGRTCGLMAALLLAISSYHISYSQEARNYSMILLLTVSLSWLLVLIVQSGADVPRWLWVGYGFVGAACLYTLAMSILVIVSHWVVFLLLGKKTRRNLTIGIGVQAGIGLAFLPWLPSLLKAQKTIALIARQQGVVPGPGWGDVLDAFGQWTLAPEFILGQEARTLQVALGAVVLAIILLALCRQGRERGRPIVVASLILVPLVGFVAMPMTRVHRFDPKHLIFIQPLCLLAAASLASGAQPDARRRHVPAGLIPVLILAANVVLLPFYYDRDRQKERWPEAAECVSSDERVDAVFVNPGRGVPYAFARYYHGRARVLDLEPGHTMPADFRLPMPAQRLWLVTCWNEVLHPTHGLIRWFDEDMDCVKEQRLEGSPGRFIRCALYERKQSGPRLPRPVEPAPLPTPGQHGRDAPSTAGQPHGGGRPLHKPSSYEPLAPPPGIRTNPGRAWSSPPLPRRASGRPFGRSTSSSWPPR
jgi:hypothetical protein